LLSWPVCVVERNVVNPFISTLFHSRELSRNPHFWQLGVTAPLTYWFLRVLLAGPSSKMDGLLLFDSVVVGFWTTTATAVGIIGFQRFQGVLEIIMLSPRSMLSRLGPLVASCSLIGFLGAPVVSVASFVIGIPTRVDLVVALALVMALFSSFLTGLVLAGIFVFRRDALVFEAIMVPPGLLVAGLLARYDDLPLLLRLLSFAHPLTGAVQAAHADEPVNCMLWFAQSALVIVPFSAAAWYLLRRIDRATRLTGTLGLS